MATIQVINGDSLSTGKDKINANFTNVNGEVVVNKNGLITTNERISNIIAQSGTSDTEVVDARGGFTVLNDRLDDVDLSLIKIAKNEVYIESYVGTDVEKFNLAIADLANGGILHFSGKIYNFTGITINKPVNLIGAGVSLTKFVNSGTGTMISYDYSVGGLPDVGKRRPIQISDIMFEDSIAGIGTGVYIFKAFFIEFNRCFFTDFTAGYAVHLDAVLWAYFNNVSTDKSEIRCIDTLIPHSNNQIFFNGGEYRNPTTYAFYIENADTIALRDLTVEGYSGTPTAGIFVKNATTIILETIYMEHIEGTTQSALKIEDCRTLSIKASLISTNQEGKPAIWLSNTSITEIEKCSLSIDPIKADSDCHGIKIKDSILYGKIDIPDNVYYKLENCEPASATVFVKNTQYQSEIFEGNGIALSNRYIDSSFREGIPTVTQTVGTPVATHDTTTGFYDNNSLKIVGVTSDKAFIQALGRIEILGQGAITSFMAKAQSDTDFIFSSSIAVASGGNIARITTEWRRYFVFSLIQPTQTALANVSIWAEFTDSNTLWMDDVQVMPINSYKEASKYIDNFRYIHTHGIAILDEIKATKPFRQYFDKTINFRKYEYAPQDPLEGDTYFADGTSWNPGAGKGLYFYDGTIYTKL